MPTAEAAWIFLLPASDDAYFLESIDLFGAVEVDKVDLSE